MLAYRFAGPLLRLLDPEAAHNLTLKALASGLAPKPAAPDDPVLATRVWGRDFANPFGIAAGFDKDARVIGPLFHLGFGLVEVGSITPRPQPGNPKPRIFRLPEDGAVINRLGFNSQGLEASAARLARWRETGRPGGESRKTVDQPLRVCIRFRRQFRSASEQSVLLWESVSGALQRSAP